MSVVVEMRPPVGRIQWLAASQGKDFAYRLSLFACPSSRFLLPPLQPAICWPRSGGIILSKTSTPSGRLHQPAVKQSSRAPGCDGGSGL